MLHVSGISMVKQEILHVIDRPTSVHKRLAFSYPCLPNGVSTLSCGRTSTRGELISSCFLCSKVFRKLGQERLSSARIESDGIPRSQ